MSEHLAILLPAHTGSSVRCGPVTATGRLTCDADLIVDGRLLEIKAVVDPRRWMTRAVQQLVVYAARLLPATAAVLLPRPHTIVELDLTRHRAGLAGLGGLDPDRLRHVGRARNADRGAGVEA